ncbi:MAG: hypothetical protein KDA53_05535 [Hyphomonas sp.]|nr:hypothetical protein [Hyphomonas sp.]
MIRHSATLIALGCLGACAVPVVDTPRELSLAWDLEPEHVNKSVETVDQGEIFFVWSATALATHEATLSGRTAYLAQAETLYGNLFCEFEEKGGTCYEDRDADGLLERRWEARRKQRSPGNITTVRTPMDLAPPVPYRETQKERQVVASQTLGLTYNGPVRANIADDGSVESIIGELALGWNSGKDAPRDPTGLGWEYVNSLVFAIIDDKMPEMLIKELGVTYTALKATVEGSLELEFQAMPMTGVMVDQEFDVEVDERETVPEDPEV